MAPRMRFELMPPIGEQLSVRQSSDDCWFQAVAVNRAWLPGLSSSLLGWTGFKDDAV